MTGPVILRLPVPPSGNNLFITRGRVRVKSQKYRSWITEAGWQLKLQRPAAVSGEWECDIALPEKLRGDIDNRVKAVLDLLVAHQLVPDDRFCTRVSVARARTATDAIVTLRGA